MVIAGTRPELIKLSRILVKLKEETKLVFVFTGQNFDKELSTVFIKQMKLPKPTYMYKLAGKCFALTISNIFCYIDMLLEKEKPDGVLILGDTNSALSAIVVKRRKIPLFHLEAGNRCFDDNVPEEINRRIIDHVSDINLVYSDIAREYLVREGLSPDRVIKVGSPMFEVLKFYKNQILYSEVITDLGIKSKDFIVFSSHREENVDNYSSDIYDIISYLSTLSTVVVTLHPRLRNILNDKVKQFPSNVIVNKPFGFFDYIHLQQNAKCVVSDSGTLTEESSILGFPAIQLRTTHERPEGNEEAAVLLSSLDLNSIKYCYRLAISRQNIKTPQDYICYNVSDKIVRLIYSFIPFVNKYVWLKK